jgi:hypothetical protein
MQQDHGSLAAPLLPTAKVPGGPQSELPLPVPIQEDILLYYSKRIS